MTATGKTFEKANLYMKDGLIQEISENKIIVPSDTKIIMGEGLTLTPGIIDVHSHMGVYPSPNVDAHEDGNEMSRPVTPDVWAEHGFWPQDPDLWRALGGGITTIQVLPGSANLIGGRSFTAKLIPKASAREMRFPGAPQGLKMACGENPKRVYKDKGIRTRMGNLAGYRKAYQEAIEYMRTLENSKNNPKEIPKRDFVSETLAKVLKGEILVHFHCYRADDISAILDMANEFGFKIRTIQHGLEAYKIAPRLAQEGTGVATWADWWGFKAEAFDGIPYNAAILEKAGSKAIIHSDSPVDVRFLNLEAGKALAAAKKLGLDFSEDQALAWITKNPAWALGIENKVGTLEEGKHADIAVWNGSPFSIYSKTKFVFINGKLAFDRVNKKRIRSDFEVGFQDMAFHDGRSFSSTKAPKNINWQFPTISNLETKNFFQITNVRAFINGKWENNTTVVVRDGKISAINPKKLESDLSTFDGKNLQLTPGFIDTNSSLGLFEIELDSKAQDLKNPSPAEPTPHYYASNSLNLNSMRIPIHRNQGITTSISSIDGGIAASQGVAFDLKHESTPIIKDVALYGQINKNRSSKNRTVIWSQFSNLIYEAALYSKSPQSVLSGRTHKLENSLMSLDAMQPILKGKKPWVLFADRADDILRITSFSRKLKKQGFNIRFIVAGGAESWKAAKQLKQQKIPVMLAPSLQTPQSFDKTAARFDLAAKLHSQGVSIIIYDGTKVGTPRLRQEAGFAVKYGLKPEHALKAITETPAKFFNLKRGLLNKGAVANMVLWSGDPLEPTSQAVSIWLNGHPQELSDRQKQLAEKYLN